jgi:hypothetical protein
MNLRKVKYVKRIHHYNFMVQDPFKKCYNYWAGQKIRLSWLSPPPLKKYITKFKKVLHWTVSSASSIHFSPSHLSHVGLLKVKVKLPLYFTKYQAMKTYGE